MDIKFCTKRLLLEGLTRDPDLDSTIYRNPDPDPDLTLFRKPDPDPKLCLFAFFFSAVMAL